MRVATSDCSRNKVELKSSKLSHVNWLNIYSLSEGERQQKKKKKLAKYN
jgi:hypothetical protein